MEEVLVPLLDNIWIILIAVGIVWLIGSPISRTIVREAFLHPGRRTKIEMDEKGKIHVQSTDAP
ncbi:MAG: hypothetical protein IID53_02175 [Proteobacteria bacterium]|nr:hypothetical protein [Pseudomonadota bacterium]